MIHPVLRFFAEFDVEVVEEANDDRTELSVC